MKHIVFTTRHYSGFCMQDTKTIDLKITNMPYRKGLLKEYVEGVRKAGSQLYLAKDKLYLML
jgi:alpha-L-fucosidase